MNPVSHGGYLTNCGREATTGQRAFRQRILQPQGWHPNREGTHAGRDRKARSVKLRLPKCQNRQKLDKTRDLANCTNVEYTVERTQHMETIQIVLDKRLLQATDRAARRTKRNRSALVRDALREHLRRLEVRAKEQRDREGYTRQPQAPDEALVWEAEAAWPAE